MMRKLVKVGVEHKINGYAISENYETLDLFITIFNGTDNIQAVAKRMQIEHLNGLIKFSKMLFIKIIFRRIEDSSEIFDLAHTILQDSSSKRIFITESMFFFLQME